MKTFSFFEVEERNANDLIDLLNNARFMNRNIVVEFAQEKNENPFDKGNYRKDNWKSKSTGWKKYGGSSRNRKERLQFS
jgi:hypothetical protein